jgi:very-short-patch-repair endonuclease
MTEPPEPQFRFTTAARQRAQGRSPDRIRARLRKGELVAIGRGVYVAQAVARRFDAVPNSGLVLRAAGAIVLAERTSVVNHRSAAIVHDIAILGGQEGEVTITRRRGRRGHRHGVHVYSTPLPSAHVTRKFGVPVTTVARTVIDIARTETFAAGVVAADSALHLGLTTLAELWCVAAECRRTWGGARADRVARFADGMAESPLESMARVVFREKGLPAPQLQVTITTADGRFIGRVDFCWRKYLTIAEVDGGFKYENTDRARAQLWRDKALRAAGYEVVHFSWVEITTQPDEVAAAIRAAFAARRAGATDPAA